MFGVGVYYILFPIYYPYNVPMSLAVIQQMLATIAITLQGLFGIVAQIDATPVLRPLVLPQIQQTLTHASVSLHNLALQIPTAISTDTPTSADSIFANTKVGSFTPPLAHVSEELNTRTRAATVNILCVTTHGSRVQSATGSGVVIDPRGVVLTNAHVAQFFLLENHPRPGSIECTVRTGSPATPAYRARLLYISRAWVEANRTSVQQAHPTGTGENDYALLLLTETVNGIPLSHDLPHLPLESNVRSLEGQEEVLLVGYPAELTGSVITSKSLHQVSGLTNITQGYYFRDRSRGALDLVEVSGTVLSQGGSSGGAVVRASSEKLLGIMVTITEAKTTGERQLFAITSAHIDTSLQKETGGSIESYLAGNLENTADKFMSERATYLRNIILDALP